MKRYIAVVAVLVLVALVGCSATAASNIEETVQQEKGNLAIIRNQPVPDLGGYSFERQVVIDTILARNRGVSTFTYFITEYDGKIVELCASRGYPIPYATQITAPEKGYSSYYTLPQAEPNSLYSPNSAEATLVQCSNKDGSVSPLYIEQRVFALPYRIKADKVLQRFDDSEPSFKVQPKP